jgi:LacI family transcriptional regulator
MTKKSVTLDDIAAHTGLSKYSVSRALAEKSGVSAETRERIQDAARSLGYRATKAKAEQRERYRALLFVPYEDVSDHEFWMETIGGAEQEAVLLGIDLITRPFREGMPLQSASERVDGVVVAGSLARHASDGYVRRGTPIAMITYPNPLEDCDFVTVADAEGAAAVAQHVCKLGHTRLGFVTRALHKPTYTERLRGFQQTAQELGSSVEVFLIADGADFEAQYRALVQQGKAPTALLCGTDGLAFTAIQALSHLGLNVPKDVSVVGFNDTPQAAQFRPKLTSVSVPKYEIGRKAVQNLHERLTGRRTLATRTQFVPQLVVRDSCAKKK